MNPLGLISWIPWFVNNSTEEQQSTVLNAATAVNDAGDTIGDIVANTGTTLVSNLATPVVAVANVVEEIKAPSSGLKWQTQLFLIAGGLLGGYLLLKKIIF